MAEKRCGGFDQACTLVGETSLAYRKPCVVKTERLSKHLVDPYLRIVCLVRKGQYATVTV